MPHEESEAFWYERDPDPSPEPARETKPRWRGVLSGGLHVAGWCLQDRLARRSSRAALGVAGTAGVAAALCLLGPLAAGLLTLGGAAFWLSGLRRAASLAGPSTP